MAVDVHLLDTATGERRVYHDTYDWSGSDNGLRFQYAEGNYECDCNRILFFERAAGSDLELGQPCGGKRFVIEQIVEHDTGRVIPFEDIYRKKPDD